jgi:hypothetical protein
MRMPIRLADLKHEKTIFDRFAESVEAVTGSKSLEQLEQERANGRTYLEQTRADIDRLKAEQLIIQTADDEASRQRRQAIDRRLAELSVQRDQLALIVAMLEVTIKRRKEAQP